jgi:hypothetical protein
VIYPYLSATQVFPTFVMGQKLFFAKKNEIAKEKRYKQLEESGYIFGAHTDEDSIREKDKRLPKTKRSFYQTVDLWIK